MRNSKQTKFKGIAVLIFSFLLAVSITLEINLRTLTLVVGFNVKTELGFLKSDMTSFASSPKTLKIFAAF